MALQLNGMIGFESIGSYFLGNSASSGGAILIGKYAQADVQASLFELNLAQVRVCCLHMTSRMTWIPTL